MAIVGWIIIVYFLIFLGLFLLSEYKEEKYKSKWSWVLLAIDIPQMNMQTPKAVEQLFSHLAGAFNHPSIAEKYHQGYKQRWFSFEIISIEGYIQFLIRTESAFRDLVEAAVYAQYPEAEITEVEDYTTQFPNNFPDTAYDMWGTDFGLAESFAYPIRTYIEFEHSISESNILKDPMGTFLESFSRIGLGEHMWFQILIEPIDNGWKEKVIEKIKGLVGNMVGASGSKKSSGVFQMLTGGESSKALSELAGQLLGNTGGEPKKEKPEKKNESNMLMLTPGQRKLLEAMENKITKIGFKTKMRAIYLARKEVFRPERSINGLVGAISQFNIPSSNSIIPTVGISTNYFLKDYRGHYRKSKIMSAYKKRKMKAGGNPFVFNIEELATIWHFPLLHVKTPLLQKSQGKRSEPPSSLPIEGVNTPDIYSAEEKGSASEEDEKIVTDAGDVAYISGGGRYG